MWRGVITDLSYEIGSTLLDLYLYSILSAGRMGLDVQVSP